MSYTHAGCMTCTELGERACHQLHDMPGENTHPNPSRRMAAIHHLAWQAIHTASRKARRIRGNTARSLA